MNIDVITVQYLGTAETTQTMLGATSTPLPGLALRRISPGMRPRSQTDRTSGPCAPAPCTRRKARTLAMMMATVTTAGRSVGFSSRYGNMGGIYRQGGEGGGGWGGGAGGSPTPGSS